MGWSSVLAFAASGRRKRVLRRTVGALVLSASLLGAPAARAQEAGRTAWSALLGTARARAALDGSQPADEAERVAAAELLGRASERAAPEVALLAALEREQAPRVREALLVALARRGRPESVPALVAVDQRRDAVERGLALRALAEIDSPAADRELALGLGVPDRDDVTLPVLVRAGPRVVPLVLRALRDAPTATGAATALGALGDTRATAPLTVLLGSEREPDRVAALRALGALGDARAADAIAARLTDASPQVVLAAVEALGALGDTSHSAALLVCIRTGGVEVRRAALGALLAADPAAGARALSAILDGETPELLGAARSLLLDATEPSLAPLLEARLPHDAEPTALAGALAALDHGAGIAALVRLASLGSAPVRVVSAAPLAVALRTWRAEMSPRDLGPVQRALVHACAGLPPDEALLLRALAGDRGTVPSLRAALADSGRTRAAAARRAAAALAVEALGLPELSPEVLAALARESDAEAFRRLADAARTLGAPAPLGALLARALDPDTGPEALALAATSLTAASLDDRRRFAVLARAALRSSDDRLRAGAAYALALAHDVRAARALLEAVRASLDDDATRSPSLSVALAAARALAALPAAPSLAPDLAAEARACGDLRVRAALLDAASAAAHQRAAFADTRGAEVLHVRLLLAGSPRPDGVGVDVRLADGRVLRRRTLPSGELFVFDLAAGLADVTLRAEPDYARDPESPPSSEPPPAAP